MSDRLFKILLWTVAIGFTGVFCVVVVPPLLENPDVLGAFAAGFVNPYASGYSADVFFCWAALAIWVVYEAKAHGINRGWICLVLGVVPGVAVGFAAYLLMRHSHFRRLNSSPEQIN